MQYRYITSEGNLHLCVLNTAMAVAAPKQHGLAPNFKHLKSPQPQQNPVAGSLTPTSAAAVVAVVAVVVVVSMESTIKH